MGYDYKKGSYTIAAQSTQQFTFWWSQGLDEHHGAQYFDVSIAVQSDDRNPLMKPLVELKRESGYVARPSDQDRRVLYLTLQNDNNFPVTFWANHVRIDSSSWF